LPTTMSAPRGMNYRRDNGDLILASDQNQFRIRCWGT
jgi:hypothetical protein